MLLNLHVQNLALIDEIEVEFGDHLNILTGETGAGKSILLGSMNAALGNKISKDMIRPGADFALVELLFHVEQESVLERLQELDIDVVEGEVLLSRKIMNRRNICKINGSTATVAKLKEVAGLLIDIHSQNEHQSLLHKNNHLKILDEYSKEESGELMGRIGVLYKSYIADKKELEDKFEGNNQSKRELDFITYEIAEIENAHLVEGEDDLLERQYKKMVNARQIMENVSTIYSITGYDDRSSAGSQLGQALSELSSIERFDEDLEPLREQLETVEAVLNDFNRDLSGYMSSMEFDEEEFREVDDRLDLINGLKNKYGQTIEAIFEYLEELEEKKEHILHFEENKKALQKKIAATKKELQALCEQLSAIRKKNAKKLCKQMTKALEDLNFLDVVFTMEFGSTKDFTANGTDEAIFCISTNPGLPVRPLHEVASGGELSRIMLAIKSVLADVDQVDTLIFDEIDSGISGRTAQKVSEKMCVIAGSHQVIAITHLPQIAAMADNHYLIEKKVEGAVTRTEIVELDQQDSVMELARMLGGVEVTEAVEHSAKEMKELALQAKSYK
ncbi:MAG: DNA repair protein RecN [Lachnospiraceae bacterium]|nr:DNA repair protein RecN [Lachnospiraceae bacterium]